MEEIDAEIHIPVPAGEQAYQTIVVGRERSVPLDKRILVSGATGMVGGELVRQLLGQGHSVTLLVRDPERVPIDIAACGPRARFVVCDLLNPVELRDLTRGADLIFHCAAKVSFGDDEFEDTVRNNTDITRHMVDAALSNRVDKLVHVSSVAALGGKNELGYINEECYPDNLNGWNGYAVSKYYSENEVWRGIRSGLNAVIVNPSVILGPGDWNGSGSAGLFGFFAKGIPFYTSGKTGYVDVRDVARAMIRLAADHSIAGERFVLSAENISFKELISLVAESVGKKPPRFEAGGKLLKAAGNLSSFFAHMTGTQNRLTQDLISSAVGQHLYDGNRITRTIRFSYTPVYETIEWMASRYLAEGKHK